MEPEVPAAIIWVCMCVNCGARREVAMKDAPRFCTQCGSTSVQTEPVGVNHDPEFWREEP